MPIFFFSPDPGPAGVGVPLKLPALGGNCGSKSPAAACDAIVAECCSLSVWAGISPVCAGSAAHVKDSDGVLPGSGSFGIPALSQAQTISLISLNPTATDCDDRERGFKSPRKVKSRMTSRNVS